MPAKMTPRERMLATIRRQPHDRVPVCGPSVWSGVQPDLMEMNYTYQEVFHDPEKLSRVALRPHTVYGFDLITIPMDMRTEAEGYGSKVVYDLPTSNGFRIGMVRDWVVNTEKDLSKLKPCDPKKVPRMAMTLETVQQVREAYPDVFIAGVVNGMGDMHTDVVNDVETYPGNPNGHFMTLYKNMSTKPKFVHQVMEILVEGAVNWGKALLEAGCDSVNSHDCAGYFGLPPAQYEEFLVQYNAKVREQVGGIYLFNECNPTQYMDMIATKIKPDIWHIPACVDIKEAGEKYGDRMCLMGNLALHSPTDLLCTGTYEMVKQKARECIEAGKRFWGYILSTECELHYGVPRGNIFAMSDAAREYGRLA